MNTIVLIASHLHPTAPGDYPDGGAFICNNSGQARDFETIANAKKHIAPMLLDPRIWRIFLLIGIPE